MVILELVEDNGDTYWSMTVDQLKEIAGAVMRKIFNAKSGMVNHSEE